MTLGRLLIAWLVVAALLLGYGYAQRDRLGNPEPHADVWSMVWFVWLVGLLVVLAIGIVLDTRRAGSRG